MAREITIGRHVVNDESPCYVIAEIGHNHQGELETCRKMFREAHDCGVSAVKLQKRDNRGLYTRAMYAKPYENENSYGKTYGEHREFLEFDEGKYRALIQEARELGVDFFATAFDHASADFLTKLEMPAYKIASGDLKNVPLLTHVARIGKPMIVSTGGAQLDDVKRAYDAVMPINQQLCLLQCTAGYPAPFEQLDLKVIALFREKFPEAVIGFSGHDNGIAMAVAAYVLGARVIEKHFTLNRAMRGTDHAFSLEPLGMKKMVRDLARTREALGDGTKKIYDSEKAPIQKMGKMLVAARALPAGHVLTAADIAIKSPADGMPPYEIDKLLGAALTSPVEEEQPLSLSIVRQGEPARS